MKLSKPQLRALQIAAAKDTGLIVTGAGRDGYDGIRGSTAWSLYCHRHLFEYIRNGVYRITEAGRAALAESESKP